MTFFTDIFAVAASRFGLQGVKGQGQKPGREAGTMDFLQAERQHLPAET